MLEKITTTNASAFDLLVQDYEEEFSPITQKVKNEKGLYELDSDWKAPNVGYFYKEKGRILGFCIKGEHGGYSDIFEFYVCPEARRQGIGKKMAFSVFDAHPGKWQVRQIEGADDATKFWRSVISTYTSNQYQELKFNDPYWGPVTVQRFLSRTQ